MKNTNSILRNYRLGQTMKITPISEPSVAVAVIADEENVIAAKNGFDDASREDDEEVDGRSSSSSRWTKCFIVGLTAGILALVAVVAVFAALPLIHTRQTEGGALQITLGMNQSGEFTTRLIKSITSNGQHGTCSIDERGYSITYTPNEGFFGVDTCTYTVVVCTDTDGCDDSTEEIATFYVEDPDDIITSPDAMVLVREERTESTASSPLPFSAKTSAVADNPCSECSITNDKSNFCGQLGIYLIQSACASQTECTERGLECKECTSVDGYNEDVGNGAYICVEEEGGNKSSGDTTTTATTTTDNPCSECSITHDKSNFCGQLGIYLIQSACASQTECTERGLECKECTSVDGYNEDVGNGAYICVEEEGGSKAAEDTTTTTTTALPTTMSSPTTTTIEASLGGFESLIGTKWKAAKIMWRLETASEELKDTTEEDRNPITLVFKSDYRVGGTCGNNSCSSSVSLRADQVMFGKFRRTRMAASEQEQNYVYLLEENMFYYDIVKNSNGSLELHLREIVVEDGVERRGQLMATYVELSSEEEV